MKNYPEQLNFLAGEGTTEKLVAIAYLRGDRGKYGGAARDMLTLGIETWLAGLSEAEKKRYHEILRNLQAASVIADNPSAGTPGS